jgi:hypothetical protein
MTNIDVDKGLGGTGKSLVSLIAQPVPCLFSHKCNPEYHDFAGFVRPIFESDSVVLLVDPFGPGVGVHARIQALEFQALLFLFSPQSWASEYCQAELAAAKASSVPVFAIRWSGELPEALRTRIFVNREGRRYADMADELRGLAQAIRVRGSVRRLIEKLRFPNRPETVRAAAERLADEPDCTALAEFLDCLERVYSCEMDPIARGSLAFAVGKTGTIKGKQMLSAWKSPRDHPYPQECISQALEWIGNKQTNKTAKNI